VIGDKTVLELKEILPLNEVENIKVLSN